MKTSFKLLLPLALATILSCSISKKMVVQNEFSWLNGKWKLENSQFETYEHWSFSKDGTELEGLAYKITNGTRAIKEYLRIHQQKGVVYYEPTVPDQNDGKPVPFEQIKTNEKWVYRFENLKHDFPTYIEYRLLTPTQLEVEVGGHTGRTKAIRFKFSKVTDG